MEAEAAETQAVVATQLERNAAAMHRLGQRLRDLRPRAVVTCARGSSDHAATYARYLLETRVGVLTSSASPSVSSVYGAHSDLRGAVMLAISQSGTSPDLLATVASARRGGALVVALVNVEDSPLAREADEVLPLAAGPERSVAATKSYLASLAALAHLTAEWTQDAPLLQAVRSVPASLAAAGRLHWPDELVASWRDVSSAYVIGRGLGLGIVQEWALKLKETCRLHAEAQSAAEVRHGPMALVRAGFPALVLAQHDETYAGVVEVAAELVASGARVSVAGADVAGTLRLPTLDDVHPALEPMLATLGFYRFANALSLARGLDPDRPAHLQKVTRTL